MIAAASAVTVKFIGSLRVTAVNNVKMEEKTKLKIDIFLRVCLYTIAMLMTIYILCDKKISTVAIEIYYMSVKTQMKKTLS